MSSLIGSVYHDPNQQLDYTFLPSMKRCASDIYLPGRSNTYLSFDFLFWESSQKGLEYALKNNTSSFEQNIQVYEPNFRFHPAFRVGAGFHLPFDNWDLNFIYTRYFTSSTSFVNHSFSGNPHGGIRSVWISPDAFSGNNFRALWQDSGAKWKLHSNFFDLFLKHAFSLSPTLLIEPGFGLKLVLLQQRYTVFYRNGNTSFDSSNSNSQIQFISSNITMKNRSFNLGMGANFACRLNIWKPFDLFVDFCGSLFATDFHIARKEFDLFSNSTQGSLFDSYLEKDSYWTIRPEAGLKLGFGWSDCTCRPKNVIYYGLSIAYEAQCFWKQNMLQRLIDETSAAMIAPTQGDLFFHGLTFEGFIDF